jgi:hypothetical protein
MVSPHTGLRKLAQEQVSVNKAQICPFEQAERMVAKAQEAFGWQGFAGTCECYKG